MYDTKYKKSDMKSSLRKKKKKYTVKAKQIILACKALEGTTEYVCITVRDSNSIDR